MNNFTKYQILKSFSSNCIFFIDCTVQCFSSTGFCHTKDIQNFSSLCKEASYRYLGTQSLIFQRWAVRKFAKLRTFFQICGPSTNVTIFGFAICRQYIFRDLRFSDLRIQLFVADLKLPQIRKYIIVLITTISLKCSH